MARVPAKVRALAALGAAVTLAGCGPGGGGDDSGDCPSGYCPDSVQAAWNNHFAAFAEANLSRIMLDYDADSEVWLFHDGNNCGTANGPGAVPPDMTEGLVEFKGVDAIRGMFTDLFAQLAPGEVTNVGPWIYLGGGGAVALEGNGQDANVFLTWRTTGLTGENKLDYATDTFTFKPNRKIAKQNIVVTQPTKPCPAGRAKSAPFCGGQDPAVPVKAGICRSWWGPTVSASPTAGMAVSLASLNVNAMMDYYDHNSIFQLFDTRTEIYIYFQGTTQIRQMLNDMYFAITSHDPTSPYGIVQRLVEVHEATNTVMMVFRCTAYERASMMFTFANGGDVPKIVRTNMVITTKNPDATEIQALV